jgi:hypothetical protein
MEAIQRWTVAILVERDRANLSGSSRHSGETTRRGMMPYGLATEQKFTLSTATHKKSTQFIVNFPD